MNKPDSKELRIPNYLFLIFLLMTVAVAFSGGYFAAMCETDYHLKRELK